MSGGSSVYKDRKETGRSGGGGGGLESRKARGISEDEKSKDSEHEQKRAVRDTRKTCPASMFHDLTIQDPTTVIVRKKKHYKTASAIDFCDIPDPSFEKALAAVWEEDSSEDDLCPQSLVPSRNATLDWATAHFGTNPPDLFSPIRNRIPVAPRKGTKYGSPPKEELADSDRESHNSTSYVLVDQACDQHGDSPVAYSASASVYLTETDEDLLDAQENPQDPSTSGIPIPLRNSYKEPEVSPGTQRQALLSRMLSTSLDEPNEPNVDDDGSVDDAYEPVKRNWSNTTSEDQHCSEDDDNLEIVKYPYDGEPDN